MKIVREPNLTGKQKKQLQSNEDFIRELARANNRYEQLLFVVNIVIVIAKIVLAFVLITWIYWLADIYFQ